MERAKDRIYTREEYEEGTSKAHERGEAKGFDNGYAKGYDKAYDSGQVAGIYRLNHRQKYTMDKTGIPRDIVLAAMTAWDARVRLPIVVHGGPVGNGEGVGGLGHGGGDDINEEIDSGQDQRAGTHRRTSLTPAFDDEPYVNQPTPGPFQMRCLAPANVQEQYQDVRTATPMARAATQDLEQAANAIKSQQEDDDDDKPEFISANTLNPSRQRGPSSRMSSSFLPTLSQQRCLFSRRTLYQRG